MKIKGVVIAVLLSALSQISFSQSVGIGTTAFTPAASCMLEIQSTTKGLLIPRVALSQTTVAAPVTAPATSLIVFNTSTINDVTPGYYYWTGVYWARIFDVSNGKPWLLSGNAGTTPGTDFLGTTDARDLVVKTNNTEWMRVSSAGNVGIGTASPSQKLNVAGNSLVSANMYVTAANYGIVHYGSTGIMGGANGWQPNSGSSGIWIEGSASGSECGGFFANGNNAVIWSPGDADILRVYDEDMLPTGDPRFIIDGSGNVGIKTPTTEGVLDVTISGENQFVVRNDNNVGVEIRSGTSLGTPYIDFSNDDASDYDARIILAADNQLNIYTQLNGQQFSVHSEGIAASGTNKYMNFNTIFGASGYGFRDNGGVLEYKHSGGVWSPFAQPPTVPGNVEWWIRPTSAAFIQPMYNVNAKVYDAGQTWAFYYDGSNSKGSFFGGGTVGAVMHRSGVPSTSAPNFTWDQYPFIDVGTDGTITATDNVTYSGGYAFGSAYNGFTGIGTLDAGLRGIGLGNSSGTNSSWPVVGVIGEVVATGSSSNGQQGIYGWQAATPGAANYCTGVLGRTSQSGTQSAGVVGYYTSTVGTLTTCFTATNYGLIGTSARGIYYGNGLAGSGTKSCVVRTTEGPKALYCVESPENYFEDYGTAHLVNGRAVINIDPLFLETILIDENNPYKVFIQLVDEIPNNVHIVKKNNYFEVVENNGGTSNAEFDWRLVAKRKGYENLRLETVNEGYGDPNLYPDSNDPTIPEEFRSYPQDISPIDKAKYEEQLRNM